MSFEPEFYVKNGSRHEILRKWILNSESSKKSIIFPNPLKNRFFRKKNHFDGLFSQTYTLGQYLGVNEVGGACKRKSIKSGRSHQRKIAKIISQKRGELDIIDWLIIDWFLRWWNWGIEGGKWEVEKGKAGKMRKIDNPVSFSNQYGWKREDVEAPPPWPAPEFVALPPEAVGGVGPPFMNGAPISILKMEKMEKWIDWWFLQVYYCVCYKGKLE